MTRFVVTIKVRSKDGTRPKVRTLGGDTIFVFMEEGMTATATVKRVLSRAKR